MPDLSKNEIRRAVRLTRGGLLVAGVFSFFINALMLIPIFYMFQILRRVIPSGNTDTLLMLSLIAIFLVCIMGVLSWLRKVILARIAAGIEAMLEPRTFDVVFEENLQTGGEVGTQSLSDLATLQRFFAGSSVVALFDAPWLPFFIAILYLLHPVFGYIAIFGGAVLVFLAILNNRINREDNETQNHKAVQAKRTLGMQLRNAEVVEALGMRSGIQDSWKNLRQERTELKLRTVERAAMVKSFTRVFRLMLGKAVLGYGAYLVIQGEMLAATMIVGSILMGRALSPLNKIIGSWKMLGDTRIAYNRLTELYRIFPEKPRSVSLPQPSGHLRAVKASVRPPGSSSASLRQASFEIIPGECVGVIGPSGSGKSTLTRAVLGIWPTSAGKIRLDGAEASKWNRAELGPHLGYLPQDVELFNGTVAENIARFQEHRDEDVIEAARLAGVHEMILRLPLGYETPVGVGGSRLSAGQRQRVALARALFGKPCLVVLDEPNSNLDTEGDEALIAVLRTLKQRGATVIIVTHKPDVLKAVDRVMTLEDGRIKTFSTVEKPKQRIKKRRKKASRPLVEPPCIPPPGEPMLMLESGAGT